MKPRSIAAAVEALGLPAGVDSAWFIREVERIAATTRESLEREIERHRRLAQLCADTHRGLLAAPENPWDDKETIVAALKRWEEHCGRRADFLAGHLPRWRTWKFMELLILARGAGLDLSYTTQPPSGPGADYPPGLAPAIGRPVKPHRARSILVQHGKMQIGAIGRVILGGPVPHAPRMIYSRA